MKTPITICAMIAACILGLAPVSAQTDGGNLQKQVADASGMEASLTDNGVVRLGWLRDDVPVKISRRDFPAAAGLGSWAAFKPVGRDAIVMGDTVVFADEIAPAMDAALSDGLRITALHNHFVFDDPPVYFMHIGGVGDPEQLAKAVKDMWDAIKAVRKEHPQPQRQFAGNVPAKGDLDADALAKVLKTEGTKKDGVVKFTFGRNGQMAGIPIGPSMGLSTWAAFSGANNSASVDGDFIMTGNEVQPVLKALRGHDIEVVALHTHMIDETPKFYFLHYWGSGPAEALAKGVRAGLDAQHHLESSAS